MVAAQVCPWTNLDIPSIPAAKESQCWYKCKCASRTCAAASRAAGGSVPLQDIATGTFDRAELIRPFGQCEIRFFKRQYRNWAQDKK